MSVQANSQDVKKSSSGVVNSVAHANETTGKNKSAAQRTALLRRRKAAKVVQERVKGIHKKGRPLEGLQVYDDYPILDMSGEFQGQFVSETSTAHCSGLLTADEDANLATEHWIQHGLSQNSMASHLPMPHRSTINSMDLMY